MIPRDLFDYPDGPGHNWRDTSIVAAAEVKRRAAVLREQVYATIKRSETLTVHECASVMGRPVPSIQPRFSELAAKGLIVDSGIRRRNAVSGKTAIAWRIKE